jgi:hypothetical protein
MSKIEELRARLKADPGSRHFYYLGEELRKAGQHQEAITVLRQGLTTQPAYASAWIGLGRTLKELGQHGEAIESLKKGLELDPSNAVPARLLAESYLAVGNKLEAIKKFKFFNAVMPGDEAVEEAIERLERELAAPAAETPHSESAEVSSDDAASMRDGELIDETSGDVSWSGSEGLGADAAEASAEPLEQSDAEFGSSTVEPLFEESEQQFDASQADDTGESDLVPGVNPRSDRPHELVFDEGDLPSAPHFDHPVDETAQAEPGNAEPEGETLVEADVERFEPDSHREEEVAQPRPVPEDRFSEPVFDDLEKKAPQRFTGGQMEQEPEPIGTYSDAPFAADDAELPEPDEPTTEDQQPPLADVIAWPGRSDVMLEPEALEEPVPGDAQRFNASSDETEYAPSSSPGDRQTGDVDPGARKAQVVSRLENWLSAIRRDRDV